MRSIRQMLLMVTMLMVSVYSRESFAQTSCPSGYDQLIIEIIPDAWPYDISW